MNKLLESLNEEQQKAVQNTEGYIRVIAGAGSGKTRALTNRYAYIVEELGISTSNILCVTFTNKAANEMKRRIRKLIGDNDLAFICTFHGFCVQVLRQEIYKINYPKNFMILDTEDTEAILKNVYKTGNIKSSDMTFQNAREYIGGRKEENLDDEYITLFTQTNDTELLNQFTNAKTVKDKIFYGYLYEQKKCFGLDFNDLILLTLHIFKTNKDILIKWQEKLEYIMVDEFQDVSGNQYKLCKLLSGIHNNLFVVGDPDQTIYSWRGADVKYILDFDKAFDGAETILMNKNYRSSPNIVNASNSLISKNKQRIDKKLIPMKESGTLTIYNHAKNVSEEASWIANQILLLANEGIKASDIAILYRAHYVSRAVEEQLMRNDIKYTIYSGISFYSRKEIKDILCYLRMITNADDISLLRTINEPKRNIGEKRITILKNYASAHNCSLYEALKNCLDNPLLINSQALEYFELIERYRNIYKELSITNLLQEILTKSGYEEMLKLHGEDERLANLAELKQSIVEYEHSSGEEFGLEDYLSKIALFTNTDKEDATDTVKLMTVHTAKGLEFPYVFVCGLNEGIFPTRRTDTPNKLEEERRLAYVAFTRAEKALFLSDAEGINYDGTVRYPSRFIFNVDKSMLYYSVELEERLVEEARNYIEQQESYMVNISSDFDFEVGDLVVHKAFGEGLIVEINEELSSYVIKFNKLKSNRTISIKTPLTLKSE